MQLFTLDFEGYFDHEYSLSRDKLTTEEYVRDPRFEAFGAAITDGTYSEWLLPHQLASLLSYWKRTGAQIGLICHHAHFDGLILSHHFGYAPDLWIDTLSMARFLFDASVRKGLESLAARFGLQPKSVPYEEMKGLRWAQMHLSLQQRIADGCAHDCFLTHSLAGHMLNGTHPLVPYPFPPNEIEIVDATVRMFTEPCLVGDLDLLGEAWHVENNLRKELFAKLGVTGPELRQDDVFAELLRQVGVNVTPLEAYDQLDEQSDAEGIKVTAKGNVKYAFAKSDYFMQDLLTSQNEAAVALAEARLKAQSSIAMSRTERYGDMATRGPMCIYLAYAAAHTRRWGGGDKTNFQNLPACRNPDDPVQWRKGALRRAIKAP